MVPISSLHFSFLQQANHTNSEYLKQTDVVQIDYYLNRAKDCVIEWLASADENNDTIRKHLTPLVVRDKLLLGSFKDEKVIVSYPSDYYKHKSLYVLANRTGCDSPRRFVVRRPSSEKVQRALKNTNAIRYWDFEETFAQEAEDGIHVYKDRNLTYEVYLDYIKKVPDMFYVSGLNGKPYIAPGGELIQQDQNLVLNDDFFKRKIVNLAVLEVKKDYSQFNEYQSQKDYILSIDRI